MGEQTNGGCFLLSHWCCHIFIFFPFPICQWAPFWITFLPLRIFHHAYDPELESLTSIIEQLGKNRALNTLKKSEFLLCNNLQVFFANKESLNIAKSRKPILPTNLDFVNSSHQSQWIFLLSPQCPHQNFLIKVSVSLHKPMDNLKHPIVKVGMTWIIDFIKTSRPACDNNFPSQPCNFLHILSLM